MQPTPQPELTQEVGSDERNSGNDAVPRDVARPMGSRSSTLGESSGSGRSDAQHSRTVGSSYGDTSTTVGVDVGIPPQQGLSAAPPASGPRHKPSAVAAKENVSLFPSARLETRVAAKTIAAVTARHLPLVLSTFRGELTLEAVQRHETEVNEILVGQLARKQPVVYIVDARGLSMPSALVRRHWANRINESRSVLEALLGTFIVVDNAFLRGALTAIAWMTDAGNTLVYAASLQDAVLRANERLVDNGHAPANFAPSTHSVAPRV